jgi:amino acid transporter
VAVSGVAGWVLLASIVLAAPDVDAAAAQGEGAFFWVMGAVLPGWLAGLLYAGIIVAQYLCGLATVTSASRMAYAFARDGGLPFSGLLRRVSPTFRTPAPAVWAVTLAAVLFTVYTPVYSTITAVCVILLYISYVLPTALGLLAYGRSWTALGPWHLGRWYRPLAVLSVVGCGGLLVLGMAPPNDSAIWTVAGLTLVLAGAWFGFERRRFPGPPLTARLAGEPAAGP